MFNQTIHVCKPLELQVRSRRLEDSSYVVISDNSGFTMIFDDLETLNDFTQTLHGAAQVVRQEEEFLRENAPTGA